MTVANKLRLRVKYHRRRARQLSAEAGATARMWSHGPLSDAKAATLGALLGQAYQHSDEADYYEHALSSGWADRADAMLREVAS